MPQDTNEDFEWNDGYWTEGLDRIHNIGCIVDMMLTGHPAVVRAELSENVEDLLSNLGALYQKMGQAIPDEEW